MKNKLNYTLFLKIINTIFDYLFFINIKINEHKKIDIYFKNQCWIIKITNIA